MHEYNPNPIIHREELRNIYLAVWMLCINSPEKGSNVYLCCNVCNRLLCPSFGEEELGVIFAVCYLAQPQNVESA